MDAERLLVGRIVKAHGIRGEVAVEVLSDAPDRFAPGSRLGVGDPPVEMTVAASRPHQGRLLVRFGEVLDRTAAELLRGLLVTIPFEDAQPLPEGSYYPWQLEGSVVVDVGGRTLGTWVGAEETPANDVWVIRAGDREVLVPAVSEVVRQVDVAGKRIVLDPPEGLF